MQLNLLSSGPPNTHAFDGISNINPRSWIPFTMFSLLRDVIEILQNLGTFSVLKQNWSSNFDPRNLFYDILVIDISPSFGVIIIWMEMLANMVYLYCGEHCSQYAD